MIEIKKIFERKSDGTLFVTVPRKAGWKSGQYVQLKLILEDTQNPGSAVALNSDPGNSQNLKEENSNNGKNS